MTKYDLVIGEKYNWKHQSERLVYRGVDFTGFWHRFAKVDKLHEIWCEVLEEDLRMMERTNG